MPDHPDHKQVAKVEQDRLNKLKSYRNERIAPELYRCDGVTKSGKRCKNTGWLEFDGVTRCFIEGPRFCRHHRT